MVEGDEESPSMMVPSVVTAQVMVLGADNVGSWQLILKIVLVMNHLPRE